MFSVRIGPTEAPPHMKYAIVSRPLVNFAKKTAWLNGGAQARPTLTKGDVMANFCERAHDFAELRVRGSLGMSNPHTKRSHDNTSVCVSSCLSTFVLMLSIIEMMLE